MSRLFDEIMFEQQQKEAALLDVPDAVASNTECLQLLQEQLFNAETKIEELQSAHEQSQKWQSKMREYVLAGIIGGLIGIALSHLLM